MGIFYWTFCVCLFDHAPNLFRWRYSPEGKQGATKPREMKESDWSWYHKGNIKTHHSVGRNAQKPLGSRSLFLKLQLFWHGSFFYNSSTGNNFILVSHIHIFFSILIQQYNGVDTMKQWLEQINKICPSFLSAMETLLSYNSVYHSPYIKLVLTLTDDTKYIKLQ